MRAFLAFLLVLIVIGVIVGLNSVFTVSQTQQAMVFQLGRQVATYNAWGQPENPGLKFKLPIIENVVLLDRRNLVVDTTFRPDQEEDLITASDQQRLSVDAFARWRISDPLLFYQSLASVEGARQRLSAILDTAVRVELGLVDSSEIISGQRAALMRRIQQRLSTDVTSEACPPAADAAADAPRTQCGWGIEIIDVKIRRVELPQANRQGVFARMAAERIQEAQGIRAEGREEAAVIRAEADRQVRVILAEAREEAERTQGEGDALRNEIYAAAYSRDSEFFSFYRAMLAYEAAIAEGTTMLLTPNGDFFRYFSDEGGGVARE